MMPTWILAALAIIRAIPDVIKLVRAITEVIKELPKDQRAEKKAELKDVIKHHNIAGPEDATLSLKLKKFQESCKDVCQD